METQQRTSKELREATRHYDELSLWLRSQDDKSTEEYAMAAMLHAHMSVKIRNIEHMPVSIVIPAKEAANAD